MESYPHLPMARVMTTQAAAQELACGGVRMSRADAFATDTMAHPADTP
jgi:hypothetical protein